MVLGNRNSRVAVTCRSLPSGSLSWHGEQWGDYRSHPRTPLSLLRPPRPLVLPVRMRGGLLCEGLLCEAHHGRAGATEADRVVTDLARGVLASHQSSASRAFTKAR